MTTKPGPGQERPGAAAGEAREALAEDARKLSDEARRKAEDLSHQARDRAESARRRAGDEVENTSGALSRAADELEPGSVSAQLLRQASDSLAEIARTVQGRDLGEMAGQVAAFGRRNPVAFLGAAALAGFALGRFATARPEHAGAGGQGMYGAQRHGAGQTARTVAPTPPQGTTGTGPVQPPATPGAGMAPPGPATGNPPPGTGTPTQKGTKP